MGKMQRTKGAAFERWLVRKFNATLIGHPWKRGLQSRGGGAEVPDLDGPVFHVEAKHQIRPNIAAALHQAEQDTDGRIPVAVTKANREEPIVSMRLDAWLALAEEYLARMSDGSINEPV